MSKILLYNRGVRLAREFCRVNDLPQPHIRAVPKAKWFVQACAFYRPDVGPGRKHSLPVLPDHVRGINVCLDECAYPAGEVTSRNWSWPGNAVDRTPFGVVLHELGHHVDWESGTDKGKYWSDFCVRVKTIAGESGLTTYADTNPAEWFAEAMRLYVGNVGLLRELRPRTCTELFKLVKPLRHCAFGWRKCLGPDVPGRIVRSLENKGAK